VHVTNEAYIRSTIEHVASSSNLLDRFLKHLGWDSFGKKGRAHRCSINIPSDEAGQSDLLITTTMPPSYVMQLTQHRLGQVSRCRVEQYACRRSARAYDA
jgi:hypothetical protein